VPALPCRLQARNARLRRRAAAADLQCNELLFAAPDAWEWERGLLQPARPPVRVLDVLRDSVVRYDNATDAVAEEEWEAAR